MHRSAGPSSYEAFKPKFPADPFAQTVPSGRQPWTFDLDVLTNPLLLHLERRVILTVGQPSLNGLEALYESPLLASSLVIVACHRPPPVPSRAYPAVHILRLRTPIAVEDAGATRLIDILNWAVQVAKIWRRENGSRVQELLEEVSAGPDSVKLDKTYGRLRHGVAYDASLATIPDTNLRTSRRWSLKSLRRQSKSQTDSTNDRPFDVIVNFLPSNSLDKAVLKSAILVTTLTRPYMSHPPDFGSSTRFRSDERSQSRPSLLQRTSSKRWSFFRSSNAASKSSIADEKERMKSRSSTTLNDPSQSIPFTFPALTRARRARILHIMAPSPIHRSSRSKSSIEAVGEAHLIRSIETFLLSFCYGPTSSIPLAGLPKPKVDASMDSEKARPYVLPAKALSEILHIEDDDDVLEDDDMKKDWTMLDLVMSGMLEGKLGEHRQSQRHLESSKGKEKEKSSHSDAWQTRRAWISGIKDVFIKRSDDCNPPRRSAEKIRPIEPKKTPNVPEASSVSLRSRSKSTPMPSHDPRIVDETIFERPRSHKVQAGTPMSRKERKQRLASYEMDINKRLPTPPEDPALEEEEVEAETSYSHAPVERRRSKSYHYPHRERYSEEEDRRAAPRLNHHERFEYDFHDSAPKAYQHLPAKAIDEVPSARRSSRYPHSSRAPIGRYDLPTPPDSDEAEIEIRVTPSPSYPYNAHHSTPYRYDDRTRRYTPVPSVLRVAETEPADEYLAELKELELRKRRSRSHPHPRSHQHYSQTTSTPIPPRVSQPTPLSPTPFYSPRPGTRLVPRKREPREGHKVYEENALGLRKSSLILKMDSMGSRSLSKRHS